jgi:prevent-host-death family protein
MKEYTSTEMHTKLADILDNAYKREVALTKYGRATHVVMSYEKWYKMREEIKTAKQKLKKK